MTFDPERRGVATEGQAERIAAQHLEHRRQRQVGFFLGPRRDRERLDFLPPI
jgi:hypothetical protein